MQPLKSPAEPSRCYIATHFRGEAESALAFFRMLSVRERTFCCSGSVKLCQDVFFHQNKRKRQELCVMVARGQSSRLPFKYSSV